MEVLLGFKCSSLSPTCFDDLETPLNFTLNISLLITCSSETQYFYCSVSSIFPEAWVWVYVSRIKWMCRPKVISLHRRFSTSLVCQQIISSKSKRYLSTMVIQQAKQVWKKADAVCFDVDSTVITDEGIDELAAFCGKGKEVSQWYVVMQLFQFIRTSLR